MVHSFLRSIGFSELKKNKELYKILQTVVNCPDEQAMYKDADENEFACFSKNLGGEMGISVCGYFVNEREFRVEYYYPYLRGTNISSEEPIEIERHASTQAFAGICDDVKLGVTLIFYVDNVIDVMRETKYSGNFINTANTVLSGLAESGKILLPVMKTKKQAAIKQKTAQVRMDLLKQARDGNQEAMENLTMNDMDTYSNLSRRVRMQKEDILTIVESSIIPYGVESDQYTIIGEITSCFKEINEISGEKVWILNLLCNNIPFDVCINEKDLYGEPEIGRRFRGRVWMQGHLNFGY